METKYRTSNENLLFVGTYQDEEYYQKIDEVGGWSFMGLRPETEETLRERQRETTPEDFGYEIPGFMSAYFDYDKWAEDMEDRWEENHDVQATRENEDGETLYLGVGSGQGAKHYFNSNNITTYADYCNHFEVVGLTKKEFESFVKQYVNF